MARIAGIDIPGHKRAEIALTYIYGIAKSSSRKILAQAGISVDKKVDEFTDAEVNKVREIIEEKYNIEGNLKSETLSNIKRLLDIGCYRGLRHRKSLPCRGQRTKNNSRTRKGKRKTVANKKKATK